MPRAVIQRAISGRALSSDSRKVSVRVAALTSICWLNGPAPARPVQLPHAQVHLQQATVVVVHLRDLSHLPGDDEGDARAGELDLAQQVRVKEDGGAVLAQVANDVAHQRRPSGSSPEVGSSRKTRSGSLTSA